jgi:valyl-tRNA synthetase
MGKRHNLEFINVIDDNGLINELGSQFAGQPRFKVRGSLHLAKFVTLYSVSECLSHLVLLCSSSFVLTQNITGQAKLRELVNCNENHLLWPK